MTLLLKYAALTLAGTTTFAATANGCASANASGGTGICAYAPSSKPAGKLGLSSRQAGHAKAVIQVAASKGLSERAAVIGIATTLRESQLDNGVVGDHGTAFGIFQQRPVSGWGTYATATDPTTAAQKFYARMVKVSGWKNKSLTVVAQTVQRSAHPDAYAAHESRAERIVNHIAYNSCKKSKKSK